MRTRLVSILCFVAVLAASTGVAHASHPSSEAAVDRAVAFLASQQRADGGFGPAEEGFPGFETPDAVLAIADAGQADLSYSPDEGRAAVLAVRKDGRTGLDYLDDLSEGELTPDPNGVAGRAALLVLDALAVGLDPTAFDPQGDGAVNLLAVIEDRRAPDGSYGNFGGTLAVLTAYGALGSSTREDTVDYVVSRQQANGGWNYLGDPDGTDEDADITGRAIQALVAADESPASDAVRRALAFLAATQNDDGSWDAFGSPDPNATAMAVLGVTAAGYEVQDRCWREVHAPGRAGQPYVTPDAWLRSQQAPDGRIASPADEFGVNTFATSQAVQALQRAFQPRVRAPRQPCPTNGYRLVAADGGVFAFGASTFEGSLGDRPLNRPIVTTAATPSGRGYWLFASDGGAFAFGDAPFLGSLGDIRLNQPIVAAAATPSGGGYWLFASDGGVFSFGDAPFLGSLGLIRLNQPIVAAAVSPSGEGYWLFAADGGVFAFGDAPHVGSLGGTKLNRPIVSGDASRVGAGYWLFADDGGVFAFGDANFLGSMGATPLTKPVEAGARSKGDGYYLVASDGGIFSFGDAPFHGSTGATALTSPVVGINR